MSASVVPQIVLTPDQERTVLSSQGAAVEWRSMSGERLGFATFVQQRDGWSAEEIAAAQARARRLGREYSADELIALQRGLRTPWSDDDLRQLRQPGDAASPPLSTAEVLARLAALEVE